jgi:predicted O-methyltransferase YrrM
MTEILGCVDNSSENCSSLSIKTFTTDWFSKEIPYWKAYKPMFSNKDNMHCIEIGSFEGRSTIYIAENYCNGNGSYTDALDTWEGSIEHSNNLKNGLYERFINNLQNHIENQRVHLYKDYSSNTLIKFAQEVREGIREKYDFAYIDGSHVAKDVLIDAVLSWEILKINGIMIFDDYEWDHNKSNPAMHPKPAIDGFLASNNGTYTILHKAYQVHIKKIADNPY